ncbi:MAG: ribosomal RNA small subunit methyltransferase E [Acidobacteriota bacterium]
MTTIVVAPIEFDGTEVELHGDAYHHLIRVKRLESGESVRIVDGAGRARRGVVARVDRGRAVIAFGAAAPSREPELRIELLVAPPKPDRAAWLVEKATEVGAVAVRFVVTDRAARGDRGFGVAQLARLRRIAIAAVEQCGRAVVPEISGTHALAEIVAERRLHGTPVVALDAGGARQVPRPASRRSTVHADLSLLIGPEGGWSDAERERFEREGVERWSLGERVLRVETAAVLAAGVVLAG